MEIKVLGIDPGSLKIGYALLGECGRQLRVIDSGVFFLPANIPFINRLGIIYKFAQNLIKKESPNEIALESLIYVKNPSSLIKLSQARGALLAAFSQTHLDKISEYAPNLIKSVVTGHGHASKEGIQRGLKLLLGKDDFKTDDESDAIAISICHLINRKGDYKQSGKKTRGGGSMKNLLKHKIETTL